MFAVIFEVYPKKERWDDYLSLAKQLKPKLEAIDGFIDNERFASKKTEGSVFRSRHGETRSRWCDGERTVSTMASRRKAAPKYLRTTTCVSARSPLTAGRQWVSK